MQHRDRSMADRTALNAFWLPALGGVEPKTEERAFGPGAVRLRVPKLTPEELREALRALRRAGARTLARRPVEEILGAVEAAARRLSAPSEPLRAELEAALPGLTGYSPPMVRLGLEKMAEGWTAGVLRGALEGEFGSLAVLDDYQPRKGGGRYRAVGPSLSLHIFSGNIPGVSVTSLIRALCVKSPSFGKTAAGEPYFAVCFARALAQEDPELAECLGVSYWPGGEEALEAVALAEVEAVIAYGSDESIADIRRRLPVGVRSVEYPNRIGAALISRRACTGERAGGLAAGAARDVATFDQSGCVAPHVIYVERGGRVAPLELAERIAAALEALATEMPRGALSAGDAASIHQLRAQAEMRGAEVLASIGSTEWTVIVETRAEFEPSPLHRVIQVRPVEDLDVAVSALARVGRRLQTVAVAVDADELAGLALRLGAIGATRIVQLGEASWPASGWHHDGRFQFMDLVRFVDLEVE